VYTFQAQDSAHCFSSSSTQRNACVCVCARAGVASAAAAGEALHGHHLHLGEAFQAVGQARGLAPAEAAPDAPPSHALVPAEESQLRHQLVRHGFSSLLLQRTVTAAIFISMHPTINHHANASTDETQILVP
jgi:hypothetical protein